MVVSEAPDKKDRREAPLYSLRDDRKALEVLARRVIRICSAGRMLRMG